MSVPRTLVLGAVSLLLSLSMLGCASMAAETALRERASKERACTAGKLTITSLGASAYWWRAAVRPRRSSASPSRAGLHQGGGWPQSPRQP